MKYCKYCGKKMRSVMTKYFNENTGKPIYKYECDDENTCSHDNHDFKIGFLGFSCRRCGYCPGHLF